MIPANGKIIVRVNQKQKNFLQIGDLTLQTAMLFEVNYREKSPVVAEVIDGNDEVRSGSIILAHHNTFYQPSPFYLYGDLYSIPVNKIIFGRIDAEGLFFPLCGNIIVNKIDIESTLSLPPQQRKQHINRYIIKEPGLTNYKEGQLVFTRPHSGYEIVYIWQNIEFRVVKIHEEMICGVLK